MKKLLFTVLIVPFVSFSMDNKECGKEATQAIEHFRKTQYDNESKMLEGYLSTSTALENQLDEKTSQLRDVMVLAKNSFSNVEGALDKMNELIEKLIRGNKEAMAFVPSKKEIDEGFLLAEKRYKDKKIEEFIDDFVFIDEVESNGKKGSYFQDFGDFVG